MILADTHVLVWWLTNERTLSPDSEAAVGEASQIQISLASTWEIAIKVGKFGDSKFPSLARLLTAIEKRGFPDPFRSLPIALEDTITVRDLPHAHGDPFDRLIAAQALRRGWSVVSADPVFEAYGCKRIW